MASNVLEITITIQPGFNLESLRGAVEDAVNGTVDGFQQDYESSVEHFEHKPTWHRQNAHWTGSVCEGSFGTSTDWYVRLSEGWPAHAIGSPGKIIPFKGWPWAKGMKGNYPPTYKRKSTPGKIQSGPGGPIAGTIQRFAPGPFHVGAVEGMHYDSMIAQHNLPLFQRLAAGIFRVARKP